MSESPVVTAGLLFVYARANRAEHIIVRREIFREIHHFCFHLSYAPRGFLRVKACVQAGVRVLGAQGHEYFLQS